MGTVDVFLADGFEEMEAFASVDVLRRAGVPVQMISVTEDEIVRGAHDIPVLCDKNIANCDFYDAGLILLPGGLPGATTLAECEDLHKLILNFAAGGKPLGVLKGKKATCYPSFDKYLEGAEYTGALVEQDGNIITGKGPAAALPFALAVVNLLCGPEKVKELKDAMCCAD